MLPRTGSGKGDRPRGVLELLACPRRDTFTIKLVASVSGGAVKDAIVAREGDRES